MKKLLIFTLSLFLVIWITSFSCEDKHLPQVQNASGLVLNYGDPAVDGCGFLIKVDTTTFAPIQLDSSFKIDSLKVILDYDVLSSTWNCGWRTNGFVQIDIKNIRKQ